MFAPVPPPALGTTRHTVPADLIDAIQEAKELMARLSVDRPARHELKNELNALEVMAELQRRFGSGFDVRTVADCLARIRITVVTGRYPTELLVAASKRRAEKLASMREN